MTMTAIAQPPLWAVIAAVARVEALAADLAALAVVDHEAPQGKEVRAFSLHAVFTRSRHVRSCAVKRFIRKACVESVEAMKTKLLVLGAALLASGSFTSCYAPYNPGYHRPRPHPSYHSGYRRSSRSLGGYRGGGNGGGFGGSFGGF